MQELIFVIGPDRAVAEMWEVLGAVGIAMEASATYPAVEGRNVRVVVRDADADAAANALLDAGFGTIDRHEVVIADLDVRPGELGRLARRIADAGTTLTTLFMATGDRVVIGADDLDRVRETL
jgi:hypothetical protein